MPWGTMPAASLLVERRQCSTGATKHTHIRGPWRMSHSRGTLRGAAAPNALSHGLPRTVSATRQRRVAGAHHRVATTGSPERARLQRSWLARRAVDSGDPRPPLNPTSRGWSMGTYSGRVAKVQVRHACKARPWVCQSSYDRQDFCGPRQCLRRRTTCCRNLPGEWGGSSLPMALV